MAKGLALSGSKIFPNIPQQICQVHFIRNLESDLITEYHKDLKSCIVKHKLTSKLKALRNSETEEDEIKNLQGLWVHIAVDHLLYPIERGIKWMSRPISYFIQYRRIKEVYDLAKRLIFCNASNDFMCRPLMELHSLLRFILEDFTLFHHYCVLEKILQWMDELRDNLRVTRNINLKDSLPIDLDIRDILAKMEGRFVSMRMESRKLGKQYQNIVSVISESFERHQKELFVPYPIVDGEIIHFRRHNNGLESSHRRARKAIRERTGRSETNREMEQFGDMLAILSNLWNETYNKEIMGDFGDLGHALSSFVKDLPMLRKEYRKIRRGPAIPIADTKRMCVLEDFIEVLESANQSNELIATLQSILGVETGAVAVC